MLLLHCFFAALLCFALLSSLVTCNHVTLRCSSAGLSGIPGLESGTSGWSYEQKNAVKRLQTRIKEIQGQLSRPNSVQHTQVPFMHSSPTSHYPPSGPGGSADSSFPPHRLLSNSHPQYPTSRQSFNAPSNTPFSPLGSPPQPSYLLRNSHVLPTPLRDLSRFPSYNRKTLLSRDSKDTFPSSLAAGRSRFSSPPTGTQSRFSSPPIGTQSRFPSPSTGRQSRFPYSSPNGNFPSSLSSSSRQPHSSIPLSSATSRLPSPYAGSSRFAHPFPSGKSAFALSSPTGSSRFPLSPSTRSSRISSSPLPRRPRFSSPPNGKSRLPLSNTRNSRASPSSLPSKSRLPTSISGNSHFVPPSRIPSYPNGKSRLPLHSSVRSSNASPSLSSKSRLPGASSFAPHTPSPKYPLLSRSFGRTSRLPTYSSSNSQPASSSAADKSHSLSSTNRWHHVYSDHFNVKGSQYHPNSLSSKINARKPLLHHLKVDDSYFNNYRSQSALPNIYEMESNRFSRESPYYVAENSSVSLETDDSNGLADCDRLFMDGYDRDGSFIVEINGRRSQIYCQFQHNGHNWMVIQRRQDGSEDFYRDWDDYESGFGNTEDEFWMGLAPLHAVTRNRIHQLLIELEDFDGEKAYARYSVFFVGNPKSNYPINVFGYSGTAGDSLSYHDGHPFSTKDHDHDSNYRANCAASNHGGWWYNSCQHSNLNGEYLPGGAKNPRGVGWYHWKHNHYSMKRSTMKIRQV